jgi:hypothetical protein
MKKTETITIAAPPKRSMGALMMSTPLSAPRAHQNKKAYDRKRDRQIQD